MGQVRKKDQEIESAMTEEWDETKGDPGYMAEMPDQPNDGEVEIRRKPRSLSEQAPTLPLEDILEVAPDPDRSGSSDTAETTEQADLMLPADPEEVPVINVEQDITEWSELAELSESTPNKPAPPKPRLADLKLPKLRTSQKSVPQLQSTRADLPPRSAANTRSLPAGIMKKLEEFRQARLRKDPANPPEKIAVVSTKVEAEPQLAKEDKEPKLLEPEASNPPASEPELQAANTSPQPAEPPTVEDVAIDIPDVTPPSPTPDVTPEPKKSEPEKPTRARRRSVLEPEQDSATTAQQPRTPPAAAPATQVRLVAENLGKQIKKHPILRGVSLEVRTGEAVGLLGPNGAGKTTCFYIMTGLVSADFGSIQMGDVDITHLPMYRRARLGIGYLPQEPSIFRGMTVEDNIRAVLEVVEPDRNNREAMLDDLLAEFSITHLRESSALALSGGERRRVEIARALASQPKFILLDEPFAGIDPIAVSDIRNLVSHLKDRGLGVLITDHNVRETLDIVDRAYILHSGTMLMEGTPQEIVSHADVRRVYLGESFNL